MLNVLKSNNYLQVTFHVLVKRYLSKKYAIPIIINNSPPKIGCLENEYLDSN